MVIYMPNPALVRTVRLRRPAAQLSRHAAQLKKQITIRLDEASVTYFKTISEDVGVPYQSLINLYLRDCAASRRKLNLNGK